MAVITIHKGNFQEEVIKDGKIARQAVGARSKSRILAML